MEISIANNEAFCGKLFSFTSTRPDCVEGGKKMTEQQFKELVIFSMEKLSETDVKHQVIFTLPGDRNDGILRLQSGYKPDEQICFSTGVVARGDDHLVQHFLHYAADMKEMSAWLRDAQNADGIIESLMQLSARVDKGFD